MNYLVGPWLFSPAHFQISSNSIKRELDPLSFKLLSYFVANANQIISRDELVEHVWQQPFVDDNAINRAISGLRKILRHDDSNEQMIKTHHRKGYSLTVKVVEQPTIESEDCAESSEPFTTSNSVEPLLQNSVQNSVQTPETDVVIPSNGLETDNTAVHDGAILGDQKRVQQQDPTRRSPLLAFALAIIVVLCLIIVWLANDQFKLDDESNIQHTVKAPREVTVTAATWNIGAESTPVTSSDGLFFAYSNIRNNHIHSIVKRLKDQREITLSYQDFNVGVMSWQVNSKRLLTQVTNADLSVCHYALFDLTSFPEVAEAKEILACNARTWGYAQLDESGTYLYYSKYDSNTTGRALYRYHLGSKQSSMLIPAPRPGSSILQAKLSRDGTRLAYVMSEKGQPLKLYEYHLLTSETRLRYQTKSVQFSYAFDWSYDDKSLLIADANEIKQVDIETAEVESIELPENLMPFYMATESTNQVLTSQRDTQTFALVKLTNAFGDSEMQALDVIESDAATYYATHSGRASDNVYFVSTRTGKPQIWRKSGENQSQLTHFSGKNRLRIGVLELSYSQEYLLFKHGSQLKFLELANGNVHEIRELDDTKIGTYVWSKDGLGIYYAQIKDDVSQIWHFDLRTRQASYQSIVGQGLLSDESGNVYYFTEQFLHRIGGSAKYALDLPLGSRVFNEVHGHYLYSSDGINRLNRLNLNSGELIEKEVPYRIRSIAVDKQQSIILTNSVWKDTHIKRIAW